MAEVGREHRLTVAEGEDWRDRFLLGAEKAQCDKGQGARGKGMGRDQDPGGCTCENRNEITSRSCAEHSQFAHVCPDSVGMSCIGNHPTAGG